MPAGRIRRDIPGAHTDHVRSPWIFPAATSFSKLRSTLNPSPITSFTLRCWCCFGPYIGRANCHPLHPTHLVLNPVTSFIVLSRSRTRRTTRTKAARLSGRIHIQRRSIRFLNFFVACPATSYLLLVRLRYLPGSLPLGFPTLAPFLLHPCSSKPGMLRVS